MNTIEIDGQEYPIKYGLSATKAVLGLVGGKDLKSASKLDGLPLDKWPDFVLAGLTNAAKIEKSDPPTRQKVEDALDADISLFHAAMFAFGQDNTPKALPGEAVEGDAEGN